MDQKTEITRKVLDILRPDTNEKDFKKFFAKWWVSTRKKEVGGLRLTEDGYDALINAGIKSYRVVFYEPIQYSNQIIIWLDQLIDCPFYITKKEVYVFSDKLAVQLILFSGNIAKFTIAKAENAKLNKESSKID